MWSKASLEQAVVAGDLAPEVAVNMTIDNVVFDTMEDRGALLERLWGTRSLVQIGQYFQSLAPALPVVGTAYRNPHGDLRLARSMRRGLLTLLWSYELEFRHVLTLAYDDVDGIIFPEKGLHPHYQVELGDQLLQRARESFSLWGRGLVVGTHCYGLLLRLMRRIAEGILSPNDVLGYWISRTEDGAETWYLVRFDVHGVPVGVPPGFFAEWPAEARELALARTNLKSVSLQGSGAR